MVGADQDRTSPEVGLDILPPEILFYLSRFLDLPTLVILATATSRHLRATFAQFDRFSLFLEPSYRFNLAEWRDAAHAIESMVLIHSEKSKKLSKTLAKSQSRFSATQVLEACHTLTKDESLVDLHLLRDVLAYLESGSEQTSAATDGRKIRSLILTGWHGMAGGFLVNQLRTQSLLSCVTTIVKTERADSRIWHQVAADFAKSEAERVSLSKLSNVDQLRASRPRGALKQEGSDRVELPPTPPDQFGFKRCTTTQAIVQVGKRKPRAPGRSFLKGEGLQIGFECLCMESSYSSQSDEESDQTSTSLDGEDSTVKTPTRLHVILQGREEPCVNTTRENEEMFERSLIFCNHCKQRIIV